MDHLELQLPVLRHLSKAVLAIQLSRTYWALGTGDFLAADIF